MCEYHIMNLREKPQWKQKAAQWFHEKWNVPVDAYLESIEESLNSENPVPQWYLAVKEEQIIGGIGVIENLTPNVCAVYVEEEFRCRGIAGKMLETVCRDMKEKGIDTLYLITDHDSFYERYGWEFYCMVQGDGEEEMTRMYVHRER